MHHPMLSRLLACQLGLALLLCLGLAPAAIAVEVGHPDALFIRGFRIEVEVAADPGQRARGLMYRESLPADTGMVFVFDQPERICMWMKNTPLPLSVAFISAQGEIVSLADMNPRTLDPHCSAGPALYALEMSQGWFSHRGIGPGQQVRGLPAAGRSTAREKP